MIGYSSNKNIDAAGFLVESDPRGRGEYFDIRMGYIGYRDR